MTDIIELNGDTFLNTLLRRDAGQKPSLIFFKKQNCWACEHAAKGVDAIAPKYKDKMNFFTVDADKSPGVAWRFADGGFPTICIFYCIDYETVPFVEGGGYSEEHLDQYIADFLEKMDK
jgi:thioredoxin-like negative regulator of GroEL